MGDWKPILIGVVAGLVVCLFIYGKLLGWLSDRIARLEQRRPDPKE
jgi:hypothetical protein